MSSAAEASREAPQTPLADVITRPTIAQLLNLAWPLIISRSAQVVVGFTDAVFVGRLGADALAATTVGATNTFNVLILPMGVAFIVQSFAAQLKGSGDLAGARRYGFYGLGIAVLAGLACALTIPFVGALLSQFDYTPQVRALMTDYMQIRLLSGGFAIGLEALGAYYGGLGNTRLPMLAQIFAMLLNVALCWMLIYGKLGLPALGVQGAAWAAVIATAIAFFALLLCFLRGVGQERVEKSKLRLSEMIRTLRFGVPAGLNWFIEFLAFSFFLNVVVAGLGTIEIAALMSVMQLNSVSFMPAFGLASSGAIFVGQAIGAKALDDVPRTVRLTAVAAGAWQLMVGLLYLSLPAFFLFLIIGKDTPNAEEFVKVGTAMLMLSCAWQLFDAAAMVLAEALRAAGDTLFTLWIRAIIAWGVFAPGAWISVRIAGYGEFVATAWLAVYLGLLALVLWLRFRTGRWRTMEMTGPPLQ
jgi:multidrug resistance protein, MATE family